MIEYLNNMAGTLTTYEPDNSLKKGYLLIFAEIFNDIKKNRWLTYQLFKRDFLGLYKQTYMGIIWALVIPIFSVGIFIILNTSGVLSVGNIRAPYPIYAVMGMMFWQLFSGVLISASNSLAGAGPTIVKINFSKKSLVIASLGKSLLSFFIQLILLVVLFFVYKDTPGPEIILIPVFMLPVLIFALGLGFIFSLLNAILRDIGNILSILATFLMFLTPVFYTRPSEGLLSAITQYNILYYLVSVPRDIILLQSAPGLVGFIISSFVSFAVFVICLVVFHLTETRITERV